MTAINEIMEEYGISVAEISRKSGISKRVLQSNFTQPVEEWPIKVLNAIALTVNESPENILHLLQGDLFSLEINDEQQLIQGVSIPDLTLYQSIKFAVKNNILEGWQPYREEIQELITFADSSQPGLEQRFKVIFGDGNE